MKNFSIITAIAAAMSLSLFAQTATARPFGDIYTDCGIGAIIAPTNDAVAAVTNVTWDLGTTAISSDISSPDTCEGGKERSAAFIYKSYANLEQDVAAGNGEHMDALIAMSGCSNSPELVNGMRSGLADSANAADYSEQSQYQKAEQFYNMYQGLIAEEQACTIG